MPNRPDPHEKRRAAFHFFSAGGCGVQVTSRQAPQVPDEAPEQPRRGFTMREAAETVGLTLLIFLAVHFSIQPYRVDGPSMQPGLHTNDLLLVNLLTYDFGSPQRGDVIVLHPPSDVTQNYVKRIVGIPGDVITLTQWTTTVDGKQLTEPYIAAEPDGNGENYLGGIGVPCPDPGVMIGPGTCQITLGPNDYWVMGDNRQDSTDSRIFGVVPRNLIIGKAQVVIFPLSAVQWLPNFSKVFAGIGN
jgi:signal peptidase I